MPGLKRSSIDDDESSTRTSSSASGDRIAQHHRLAKRVRSSNGREGDEERNIETTLVAESSDEETATVLELPSTSQTQQRSLYPSSGAENGIIESITCTNFMCHSHLHVELGPLINFVIGHNGSGKSAVLTALTICLGGKALSTNRGSTLKAFIKEGQESSTITVRIKNHDGYQFETYGESISVERTFSRTGTSGFKIKSTNGKIVSTMKSTLDEVLDHYALQLDNPICVLSQDMARQFLHSSSAADKYKFFIKGVQLEQMNQDYDLLSENIDAIERTFANKEDNLKALEQKDREASERMRLLNKQDETNRQIAELSAQMAWAQVEEQEKRLAGLQRDINEIDHTLTQSQTSVETASMAFDNTTQLQASAEEQERATRTEIVPLLEAVEKAKASQSDAEKELQDQRLEQRRIHDHIQRSRESAKRAADDIAEEEQRLSEASGGAAAARLDHQKSCRLALEEAKKALVREKDQTAGHITREAETKSAWQDCQHSIRSKEEELGAARQRLKSIEEGGPRQDYPDSMDRLLDVISHDSGFARTPVGPIGKHISLLKPIWAGLLEKTFGQILNSFIVTSKLDRDRLNDTMKRIGCNFPITIQTAHARFDVSANEPDASFDTIARVLQVDNDLVFNFLVINQRIEQLLLIENEQDATALLTNQRPKNVKACYTKDQRNPNVGHSLSWGLGGSLSESYVDIRNGSSRIRINADDQVRAQRDVVQHLRDEKSSLDDKVYRLRSDFETCIRDRQRHTKLIQELRTKVDVAAEEFEQAEEQMNRGNIEEGRLAALQEVLQMAQKDIGNYEHAFQVSVKATDQAKENLKAYNVGRSIVESRLQEANSRMGRAAHRREAADEQRQEALRRKNQAFDVLAGQQQQRTNLETQREEQHNTVLDYTRQAGELYTRCPVPEGETTGSLDTRLEKLVEEVERFQRELGGDRAKLSYDYSLAHRAYSDSKSAFDAEKDLLGLLKRTLSDRQDRWRMFRKHIAARAKTKFMYLLTERAFRGRLLVDHSKRLMDLRVQPNETESQSAARQTRTLSGGEKSFSTICLLLALWEAIGAPIRCLDEFDVFMDNANRAISMKLLISAARSSHDRQFIFITPQSMASVDRSRDVKIIKMRDPERGQTALSFTQM